MWQVIPYSLLQSILLSLGQVLLKFAIIKMGDFCWSWHFFNNLITNWWLHGCGLCYGIASLLWMYILKHFPFSVAYPMISLCYIFGMISAVVFFHEDVPILRWIGVLLIIGGCYLIVK